LRKFSILGLAFASAQQAGAQSLPASPAARQISTAPPVKDFSLTLGAAAWHGDFGAPTETDINSILLAARYRVGGLRLTASLPRMYIKSDGTFFTGLGGTPLFVAPQVRSLPRTRRGVGDLTLGASYLLPGGEVRGFDLEITGRVKLPTASNASQLSTGKVDYSVGADVSKTLGRVTPNVSATYRVFGDTGIWKLRNGFDVTAGLTYALSAKSALVVSYEYVRAASNLIADSHELLLAASTPLAGKLRVSAFAAKGLSTGAADVSGGLSLAATF
jgi:opacity protein-like surface antigen